MDFRQVLDCASPLALFQTRKVEAGRKSNFEIFQLAVCNLGTKSRLMFGGCLDHAEKAVEGYRTPRRFAKGRGLGICRQVLDCASPLALWIMRLLIQNSR